MKTLKLISLLCISIFFISCKKNQKDLTTVDFHLFNPITNEAYAGVVVKVYEVKTKGSFADYSEESKVIWEGVTDSDGKASHSFKAKNRAETFYWHYVDANLINNPAYFLESQPAFMPLEKKQKNEATYKLLQKAYLVYWYKNVNCFDETDKCRFRYRTYKHWANEWGNWLDWVPSSGSGYFEGCYEMINDQPAYVNQMVREFEIEVTRNGVTSTTRDTFYLTGLNGIDTMKLHY